MANLHYSMVILVFVAPFLVTESLYTRSVPNNCSSKKTCGDCMAESPDCYWCSSPEFLGDRCDKESSLRTNNCSREHLITVKSNLTLVKNDKPRNAINSQNSTSIQLSPQEINITLRPNEPFQFEVQFRQAANYPVDIYFIMDTSFTMQSYSSTLANFSHQLAEQIRNITTDFRLGFGSFVDKTLLPYISIGPKGKIDICGQAYRCVLPYGFRNQLPLTSNETEFKLKVQNMKTSSNLDTPEGGFDAIMQAAVCKEKIGWREHSRKMILFSTDGSFHYAGDGKLGGIVVPNDGHCHIDEEGYYSESENQDYPSISQLAHKISEKKMNLIFAVPVGRTDLYKRLSSFIVGSNVGELDANCSNVIPIVKETYDKIRSAVELKIDNVDDVQISFQVKCPDNIIRDVPHCEKLRIGDTVKFNVTIRVDSCPAEKSQWKKTLHLYPVGLTEKLIVNLDLICECPCEQPGHEEVNSTNCSNSGTYECGICTCKSGFSGKRCECGAANTDRSEQDDMSCRMTNASEVCQGRGRCVCGQCQCFPIFSTELDKRYSGKFCECDNYSCSRYLGEICGGNSRGTCVCGKCDCKSGFEDDHCGCQANKDQCTAKNGLICNGKGECKCGTCECTRDDSFKGPTCEDCPTCPGQCEHHHPCVECKFGDFCYANCSQIDFVDDLNSFRGNEWRTCRFRDNNSCDMDFAYDYQNNTVKVKMTKECPHQVSNLVIIMSVVGAVIAIGIICLLIWKIVVTAYDRIEYKAFVDDQATAHWGTDVNPIFINPTSNFENPTYKPENR